MEQGGQEEALGPQPALGVRQVEHHRLLAGEEDKEVAHPGEEGIVAPFKAQVYLRFERSDDPLLTRVRNLFVLFPGQQTVVLYLADTQRRLGAKCLLLPPLLQELKDLLGEANVVVVS